MREGGTAMNASQNKHSSNSSYRDTPDRFHSIIENARVASRVAESVDREACDVRFERMQQYATHLERVILNKCSESSELQKYLNIYFEGEKNLRNFNDRIIIRQARHAAMGEILGVISHKWRQPLNSIALIIQNIVDAWKYGEMDDDLMERSEHRAMEQVTQLTRTIEEFRSFLGPVVTSGQFDPVESVKTVVALLSGVFSDFSTVDVKVENDSCQAFQVTGCQHSFQQVIYNLLSNANDAIRERQRGINPVVNGIIIVSFLPAENDIIITVADNGGGIDDTFAEHVFEPYFTTKQNTDGFGIGLYMSKLIVEKSMNGTLWFENIPEGARFSIRLNAEAGRMGQL